MTLNEKIHFIRLSKGMSLAELAYETECSIDDIKHFETNGTKISAFILLQILKAFKITLTEFQRT